MPPIQRAHTQSRPHYGLCRYVRWAPSQRRLVFQLEPHLEKPACIRRMPGLPKHAKHQGFKYTHTTWK